MVKLGTPAARQERVTELFGNAGPPSERSDAVPTHAMVLRRTSYHRLPTIGWPMLH